MAYVVNIFYSIRCCLNIWQLQMIFTPQMVVNISLSEYAFP